jgi:hypothetical protein
MRIDEQSALEFLDKVAKHLLENKKMLTKFTDKMSLMLIDKPNTKNAFKFINQIGVNGAEEIGEDLINFWGL